MFNMLGEVKSSKELNEERLISLEAGAGIPASSNMRLVTWDPELASLAQAWADQCPGGRIEGEEVRVAIIGDQRIEVGAGGDQD